MTDIKDENGIHEGSEENQVVLVKVSCKIVNTTEEAQEYYMNTFSFERNQRARQSCDHRL